MESRKRSIAKALSWRVVAVFITSCVAWGVTREITLAVEIGVIDTLIKLGVYYGHERLWLRIHFGKTLPPPPPEYQI